MEDYKKKYEEALERARKINSDKGVAAPPDYTICETIFPELKESEDERIRKELICYFEKYPSIVIGPFNTKECIAWLEKQGESDETKAKIFLINNGYPIDSNGKFPTYEEMYYIIKDGIEKQGEQNPTNEPKFKVGDWLITHFNHVAYIKSIDEKNYFLSCGGGNSERPLSIDSIHKNWRLWDIQDAVDGDVLIDKSNGKECPFIFKETKPSNIKTDVLNPLSVLGYCGIGGAGFTKGSGWGDTANCIYYPATKEQSDTLMKAMADAGYTFDFEKKELKKIEPKQEWSEEDERIKNNLLSELTNLSVRKLIEKETEKKYASWLKSLKERYTWRPSDEQMDAINDAIDYLGGNTKIVRKHLMSLYEQLKKLKG